MSRRDLFHVYFEPQFGLLTGASHAGTITKESERSFAHFTSSKRGGYALQARMVFRILARYCRGLLVLSISSLFYPGDPVYRENELTSRRLWGARCESTAIGILLMALCHTRTFVSDGFCVGTFCIPFALSRSTKYSLHLYLYCNDIRILLKAN